MEAPDSLTMTMGMEAGRPQARTKASVSRPAVPLPMAMASIWKRAAKPRTLSLASAARISG